MKDKMFRRVVSSVLALGLAASCFVPAALADSDTLSESGTATTGTDAIRQTSYTAYMQKHASDPKPSIGEIVIKGSDYVETGDGIELGDTAFEGRSDVLYWKNQVGSVSYEVEVPEDGMYNFRVSYYALAGSTNDVQLSLLIDGESPYATATRITLDKRWVNETDILQDSRGNDMRPGQVENPCWQETPLKDVDGLFNEPLYFYMTKGTHKITLDSEKAQFVLADLTMYQYEAPSAYIAPATVGSGQKIILEGETAAYKSARTLYPTSDKTSYMTSGVNGSSPTKTRYNTIGQGSWTQSGQMITWEFNVEQNGTYKLGIFSKQDTMRGMYSNRRLYIDGVVPCAEANQIKCYYNTDFNVVVPSTSSDEPLYFDLSAGNHTISLEAVPGEIGEIMGELDEIVYDINSYYRQIRQITGPSPDEYNNYMIDHAIPSIVPDFKTYAAQLREEKKKIEDLSGSGGTEAETLEKMAIVLDKCVKKPDIIPEMMSQLKDNVTALSSFISQYREQPLEVDKLELCSTDVEFSSCETTFFGTLSHGFQSFIGSFFEDYNSLSDEEDATAMECWVTMGRDQAVVVKQLIDSGFNETASTKINLKLVQGGIVEATFSGKGPDLALFMGGDFPIQLAARGVLTDLSQKPDFQEMTERFADNAMTLYTYDGGVYGLPCEQRFPMLFYRSDVLAEYGIDPDTDLSTWEGLLNVLPTLQRNYLEVGLVLPVMGAGGTVSAITENGNTFAMLLLQQGINYYNDNQSATTFDTQEAVDAFDTWTKFYTTYSFEQTYDAFTRFRQGDMPVLIRDYTFYNQLYVAAPEIKGCWSFRPVPGTVDENGNINHSASSEGSAAIIFTKAPDQDTAWEFVKWFTSADTQAKYGNDIESVLGPLGRYATANREALEQLSWTTTELKALNEQLDSQVEIPVIPASYGVTRNLMNAFRTVVNDSENARDTLFWYNKDINDEITRKRADLGID